MLKKAFAIILCIVSVFSFCIAVMVHSFATGYESDSSCSSYETSVGCTCLKDTESVYASGTLPVQAYSE